MIPANDAYPSRRRPSSGDRLVRRMRAEALVAAAAERVNREKDLAWLALGAGVGAGIMGVFGAFVAQAMGILP